MRRCTAAKRSRPSRAISSTSKRAIARAPASASTSRGPVATIVRVGLKSQLDVVRPFVALLAKEAEKVLKDHGKTIATILKKGDAAVEDRATAATDRANHRARHILSFVDDVNAMRTSMHAELTLFAAKKRLPRDYAERFFRRTSRTSKGLEPAPEPAPSPEE